VSHLADWPLIPSPLNRPPRILDAAAGRIEADRRRKVCIYGAGVGRGSAPLTDPEWQVWTCNLIVPFDEQHRFRADRWFDIHQRIAQSADDLRWFARCPVPLYTTQDLLDAGPMCLRFPLERLVGADGQQIRGPLACTFAYQIALAMIEGATDIALCGVELCYGTRRERTVEWASVNWWMGYAEARGGVTFHLPVTSRLGRHPYLYGLEYVRELEDTKRYVEMVDGRDVPDDTGFDDVLRRRKRAVEQGAI
jgi:hypothetical protein